VVLGSFIVYVGFVEMTRYIPSPAARPELGPALRQILIGLLIILMLKFRPSGLLPERLGTDGTSARRSWRTWFTRAKVLPDPRRDDVVADPIPGAET
jgi:hypothetical protein